MSAWKDYKQKLGEARPWDLLSEAAARVPEEDEKKRYDICLDCDRLLPITHQCKECGCFMKLKTKLKVATCPLGKW